MNVFYMIEHFIPPFATQCFGQSVTNYVFIVPSIGFFAYDHNHQLAMASCVAASTDRALIYEFGAYK